MTDRTPDDPSPQELTPEQEARVRRLLAEARHTEPMPADVATRLDAVLAGLVESREQPLESAGTPAAPPTAGRGAAVVELAARRRRRRRVTQALVAAAAVTVVGFAGPSLLSDVTSRAGSDSATTAESAPEAPDGNDAGGAPQADAPEPGSDSDSEQYSAGGMSATAETPVPLRSATFDRDAAQAYGLAEGAEAPLAAAPGELRSWKRDCSATGVGPGTRLPATLDGRDGWLVFSTPADGTTRAEFYGCGATSPERSAELTVR